MNMKPKPETEIQILCAANKPDAGKAFRDAETRATRMRLDFALQSLRGAAEVVRHELIVETHNVLLSQFADQLALIDTWRDRLPTDILDALRERAFEEFTRAVNRSSGGDRPARQSDE